MSIKECSITSWFSDIQAEMYPIFIHKGKKIIIIIKRAQCFILK